MKIVLAAIALAAILSPALLAANTCFEPRHLIVHGAMRGVVIDMSGASEPDANLFFVSTTGKNKLAVHADDNAEFEIDFSSLPHGTYRVTTDKVGFRDYVGEIEVTAWRPWFHNRALIVELGLGSCSGGISRGKIPHDFSASNSGNHS